MRKKLSSIVFMLSVLLLLCTALAACTDSSDSSSSKKESYSTELLFELNPDGHSYSVTRSLTTGYSGDIIIPKKYKGLPVTEIGNHAFLDCENLLSVTIPEGVKRIGEYAFSGCKKLCTISFPKSLRYIGDSAFFGCRSLTEINFSKGLTEIGSFAFRQCSALTEIVLPESVTTVGSALFCECYSLERCVLSQNITELPGNNTWGSYGLFYDCGSLRTVTLPKKITYIPEFAFGGCGSLTEIIIPESVSEIKTHAFSMCHSLTSLTIPEGVTTIEEDAIQSCGSLFEVINKSSVKLKPLGSSGDGIEVFAKSVIENEADSRMENIDDFIFYMGEDDIYLIKYVGEGKDITLPTLHDGKKYIVYSSIFTAARDITSLTLPNSIKFISNDAFNNVTCLETLVLDCADAEIESEYFGPNETVKTVYLNVDNNFELTYFYKLDRVVCGEGLTTIKNQEFEGSNIRCIEISSTVESIGIYAFHQSDLEEIIFADNSSLKTIGDYVFSSTPITEVTIPEGVVELGEECFSYSGVKVINLPNTLKSIGKHAFQGCYMTSIDLPDSLVEIGEGAFSHCISLVNVGFGDCSLLESIGDRAFYACENLRTITVPKNVSHLGNAVIGGSGVQDINVSEENPNFKISAGMLYSKDGTELILRPTKRFTGFSSSVTIPKEVEKIAPYAFYSCMNITKVVFEEGSALKEIGDFAFWGCGIVSIEIPAEVCSIGESAFGYCQNLEEANISLCTITELADGIFADCYRLSSIFISENITRIGESALSGTDITAITYDGTVSEWERLEKGDGWDAGMGDYLDRYEVVCTDGTVSKN